MSEPRMISQEDQKKDMAVSALNDLMRKHNLDLGPALVNEVVNNAVRMAERNPDMKNNVKNALVTELRKTNPELAIKIGFSEIKPVPISFKSTTVRPASGHETLDVKTQQRAPAHGHEYQTHETRVSELSRTVPSVRQKAKKLNEG